MLRAHPGRIARAIGVESLPALTLSLIVGAALGPVGSAIALTGSSGLEGYANGLIGALAGEGVDVSNADELTRALQNKELMERVRTDATTAGAYEAGITAAAMMIGIRRSTRQGKGGNDEAEQLYRRQVERLDTNKRSARAYEQEQFELERSIGNDVAEQVTVVTRNGLRGRVDLLIRELSSGKISVVELKASMRALFRKKQKAFHDDLSKVGGTVTGAASPNLGGALELPPTSYTVRRKPDVDK